MKASPYRIFIFIILLLLSFSGITCKTDPKDRVYKGTLLVNSCGVVIVNVDGPKGSGGGVPWQDASNALSIGNSCLITNKNLTPGDRFSFKISATNIEPGSGCPIMFCAFTTSAPGQYVYLYDISKIN